MFGLAITMTLLLILSSVSLIRLISVVLQELVQQNISQSFRKKFTILWTIWNHRNSVIFVVSLELDNNMISEVLYN